MNVLGITCLVLFAANSAIGFFQGNISAGLGWMCAFMWCLTSVIDNYKI